MSRPELSPRVAELVELLGRRTALALCRAGGLIYVPMTLRPRTRLVQMIGTQGTAKLQGRYAGQNIKLPRLAALDRAARDAEIRRQAAAGVPKPEIALLSGLSVRQLHNILNR